MRRRLLLGGLAGLGWRPGWAQGVGAPGAAVSIVAAESVYGDVARQVAGADARIVSVMSSPDQDPHLFEASASVGRALSAAGIVVCNGADYDPWMTRLLRAVRPGSGTGRRVIVAAELVQWRAGDNPHLWYDLAAMAAVARGIAGALVAADPAGQAGYAERLAGFLGSLRPIEAKVAAMRGRYAGAAVTATEPVFGIMAAAVGLTMRNGRFQLAVMNGAEPRATDTAAMEADLRERRVRVLITNNQVVTAATRRLTGIAAQAGLPVVGVSETEPGGTSYQAWMLDQLETLDAALGRAGG